MWNDKHEVTAEDLDYYCYVKCPVCGAEVKLITIKQQLMDGFKWFSVPATGRTICAYCSLSLGLYDHPKGVA